MKLNVSDVVYYKGIGICEVLRKETKYEQDFYVLKSNRTKMTIMIPVKNLAEAPIRKLSSKKEVSDSIAILKSNEKILNNKKNWNQRYKEITNVIQSGEIKKIASVYSELNHKNHLSFSEKMIKETCFNLVTEEADFVLK